MLCDTESVTYFQYSGFFPPVQMEGLNINLHLFSGRSAVATAKPEFWRLVASDVGHEQHSFSVGQIR